MPRVHKNSLKLAGLYLVIIMSISLFFSVALYTVSVNELNRGLRRPTARSVIDQLPNEFGAIMRLRLRQEREAQIQRAQEHMVRSLVVINAFILVGAGLVSYYLAYRTLRPIEEAHEAQARFTADASHELRTPIAAMQAETEVALLDPRLTLADAKTQLTSNLEELAKLTALTEGLLGLARFENAPTDMQNVALQEVINGACTQVAHGAQQKQITIVPPTADLTGIDVRGDKTLLIEALVIVLDNAIKYSKRQTTITVAVKTDRKQAAVSVADSGQGIAEADLPHIFERFYRVDTARTKQNAHGGSDGYGLGLSLAHRIVEMHGGSIAVASKVGSGSTFTLRLPMSTTAQAK